MQHLHADKPLPMTKYFHFLVGLWPICKHTVFIICFNSSCTIQIDLITHKRIAHPPMSKVNKFAMAKMNILSG